MEIYFQNKSYPPNSGNTSNNENYGLICIYKKKIYMSKPTIIVIQWNVVGHSWATQIKALSIFDYVKQQVSWKLPTKECMPCIVSIYLYAKLSQVLTCCNNEYMKSIEILVGFHVFIHHVSVSSSILNLYIGFRWI